MRRPLLALLLAALVAAGCAGDDGPEASPTTEEATTTTTRPEAYAVGRRTITVVDASRPTAADPGRDRPAEPDRTMDVLLLYPAEGAVAESTTPADDAEAAEGTFPLIVFSHGWTADGPTYEGRIREWARAGYVVAAPTFPLSSGQGGVLADYANQPADVSFVIGELLDLPDDDPLAGHIDEEAIGVAGHSLGAITTIGLALNSCCTDERIDAAVEISGMRLPFRGGDDDLDAVPFLAIHGANDGVVPVDGSDSLFAEAPGPAAYLRIDEAEHSDFLATDGALVDSVVLAFFDHYLYGDEDSLDDVADVVEEHGGATFEEKPAA